MQPARDQCTQFRQLILDTRPPYQVWMQPPRAPSTHCTNEHAVTATEIAAHGAVRSTVAVPLTRCDGRTRPIAHDTDADGDAAIQHIFAATPLGYAAFGVDCVHATRRHNAGHDWGLFDQEAAPDQLRQSADDLAATARSATENSPTRTSLRLVQGVHRWIGRRGHLVLSDGLVIDVDAGTPGVGDALPCNPASLLPVATTARGAAAALTAHRLGPRDTHGTIAAYNLGSDLPVLLEHDGGRIAEHVDDGGALPCPCGQHQHGDHRPSRELRPATKGRSRRFGWASVRFHTVRGQAINAFDSSCHMEHLTPVQAVRQRPATWSPGAEFAAAGARSHAEPAAARRNQEPQRRVV